MVGLPDKNNRERILRAILEKETVSDDLDYDELAVMTEGYSGSDLKVGANFIRNLGRFSNRNGLGSGFGFRLFCLVSD